MKTFQEIVNVAYDLYSGSSSNIDEWIVEYLDYITGSTNTIWNDEGFSDWTEEEKEKCYFIILELYKNNVEKEW